MSVTLCFAACLACGQVGPRADQPAPSAVPPAARTATSRIVSVTVYQGQALATREVAVPEGEGTVELVVAPLPPKIVADSLYTEGADGLRVLSTRFRTRAVKEDTRRRCGPRRSCSRSSRPKPRRLQNEAGSREQDLQYLRRLEDFTGADARQPDREGPARQRGDPVAEQVRHGDPRREIEGRDRAPAAAAGQHRGGRARQEAARRALGRPGPGRARRGDRREQVPAGGGHRAAGLPRRRRQLVAAVPSPRRGRRRPVRLEYLAAVVQQTGEDWPDVRVTLSTPRPSLDAGPPSCCP